MKAYRISHTWDDGDGGTVTKTMYAGTQSDAAAARREIGAEAGLGPVKAKQAIEIEDVEIPTSKNELLAFVNSLL